MRQPVSGKVALFVSLVVMGLVTAAYCERESAVVVSVKDGDTLRIIFRGRSELIRLIGIDAPESKRNRKAYRDSARRQNDLNTIVAQGKMASRFVLGLVKKGDRIEIEFDVETRDRYGRLLGYVYLADGRMLNDVIIRSGYATPLTIPPNVRYADRFLASYRYAREHNLGLWQ